jgi:DNA invertase Pin-like site-specific DNA recombinase
MVYFNRRDLADQLRRGRRWLDEDPREPVRDRQVSVQSNPNPTVPRRVVDRLGDDVVQEIVAARQAGMKLSEVAKRYGISESSVKRATRNHRTAKSIANC